MTHTDKPHIGLSLALLALSSCAAAPFDVASARKQAARRPRRIIMNNDGNDCLDKPGASTGPHTAEEMLRRRTTPLLGSQVDSIFYCDGVFNSYTHQSSESEMRKPVSNGRYAWGDELFATTGKDPLATMIDFCRAHDIEIFWSMRMNDTHDSSPRYAMLMTKWKKQHPDLLISTAAKRPPFGGRRWSAVDYHEPRVRDKVFRIIEDVVTRYDVDGVELDFFRHPVYFRPAAYGKPVPQSMQDELTSLIRRIRAMIDRVAKERRKPILLSARVPDSVPFCRAVGLDLERWLDDGLLDLVAGCGYIRLTSWSSWAALGQKHGVPVYACLSASRLVSPSRPESKERLELWRGEALRAWDAGVAGIYTFNRFDPTSPLFRELGDPQLLRSLPRDDEFVPGTRSHLRTWVKGGEKYLVTDK